MSNTDAKHPTTTIFDKTIKFAQCPSDALQCLLDLKDGMSRVKNLIDTTDWKDPVGDLIGDERGWQDWQNLIGHIEPFFWSSHTADLVTAASQTYPLNQEEAINLDAAWKKYKTGELVPPPSYLPTRARGLCVFQKPCLFVTMDGKTGPLSALAWSVGINARQRALWLSLRGVVWVGGIATVIYWSDGGSVGKEDNFDDTFGDERFRFTKWICTAAMFMDQEIVTTSRAELNRGTRKRCEKVNIEPICHTVTLRKELEQEHHGSGLTTVEWSHRWLVRGHWRRQFYPKRGGNAPIWIHPHIKGPSDKPFVEPKPTVYNVAR